MADKLYSDTVSFVRGFMDAAQQEAEIDFEASREMVQNLIDSALRNVDALLSLSKLKRYDEYTYTHCVNVTVLATTFGAFLGLPDKSLRELGMAGLFHDIGKSRIPLSILNKPGKLSEHEFMVMQSHPQAGVAALEHLTQMPRSVLHGVVQHHERYDGSGYPSKLGGDGISLFGRLLAIVDVYDALTSKRVYKNGMDPGKAMQILYSMSGGHFHPELLERFIKCVGVYPVGSLVRLSSGVHGVVVGINPGMPLYPTVHVVWDHAFNAIKPWLCNLCEEIQDGIRLTIKACLDPSRYGVNPSEALPS